MVSSIAKITLDGNGVVEEEVSANEGIGVTSLTVVNAGFRNLLFINDGQLFSVFQEVSSNLPFNVVIKEL